MTFVFTFLIVTALLVIVRKLAHMSARRELGEQYKHMIRSKEQT